VRPPSDCLLVATTCCGCPDVVVLAGSPEERDLAAACDDVECPEPPPEACPPLPVTCDADGACAVGCPESTCDLDCGTGFALDALGCQLCECAPTSPGECAQDVDCVAVPADCCGCARGGADVAVPAADAAAWLDALACDPDKACPDIDVCDPAAEARCLGGACVLGPPSAELACGGAADCPPGADCVIGADEDGDGLGVCRPSP
jgi:hypothetical protein